MRIHADSEAHRAADSVAARAFTLGEHVVFGPGEYAPGSRAGQRLLAHELTHVVQQRAHAHGPRATLQREAVPDETERVGKSLWPRDARGNDLPPSIDDVKQGSVRDCFLFAAMGAIVDNDPNQHDQGQWRPYLYSDLRRDGLLGRQHATLRGAKVGSDDIDGVAERVFARWR